MYIEEEIFEKVLNKLRDYIKKHNMSLTVEKLLIRVMRDITEEVENCLSEAIKNESEHAEKVCRRSCGIRHGEATEWQMRCLDACIKCWEMTERATCAERIGAKLLEHLYAIETLLKSYGLWYHSYWRVNIDEKVSLVMEFRPPPAV